MLELLNFSSESELISISQVNELPVFVYSRKELTKQAEKALAFMAPYGLTVRYAMKANPHKDVLGIFNNLGIYVDASSEYEVLDALSAGIPGDRIALNSQQLPRSFDLLTENSIFFTATSLHQLEEYGKNCPGTNIGVRLNPGDGSGASNRVTTGGKNAGFGIWFEYIQEIKALAQKYNLTITKLHTHIGASSDPEKWQDVAETTLQLAALFYSVTIVSLGGGFKVARMSYEQSADLQIISKRINSLLLEHAELHGQKLHLEIEPGTFLTANTGILLAHVIDIVDTGANGHTFLRISSGMNDILRPTLYGAQHPIIILPHDDTPRSTKEYLVIGHNCESGDILTPAKNDPEGLLPRQLTEAKIGDIIAIGGTGAYCASMRARGYNSYPDTKELFID